MAVIELSKKQKVALDVFGYGSGSGDGSGYGDGAGYGSGYGYGYGYGDGSGSGYGYGYGDGSGYGYGDGRNFLAALLSDAAKRRAKVLKKSGCELAYWRSDAHGRPANGGSGTVARVGLVEEIEGPLVICTAKALHGTTDPQKWKGDRLWIVALYPPVQVQDDKIGSLKREILCEVVPNFYKDLPR